jgi:hypothetical protein
MIDRPTPGLGRNPVPADVLVPGPAAVHVRPPVVVDAGGGPDVAVGLLVGPAAVLIELLFVVAELGGQVPGGAPAGEEGVPGFVPLVESVGPGRVIAGVADEAAVRSDERLPAMNNDGAFLSGGLEAAFEDDDLGLLVGAHVEPVEAFLQNVRGRIGGMDLDCLVAGECADPEVGAPFEDMERDPVIPFDGQEGKFHPSVVVQPEVVPTAEMDFGLADPGPELVSPDQGQVHLRLLRPEVRGPLDEDVSADVGKAGETRSIIALRRRVRLGAQAERDGNEESDR